MTTRVRNPFRILPFNACLAPDGASPAWSRLPAAQIAASGGAPPAGSRLSATHFAVSGGAPEGEPVKGGWDGRTPRNPFGSPGFSRAG